MPAIPGDFFVSFSAIKSLSLGGTGTHHLWIQPQVAAAFSGPGSGWKVGINGSLKQSTFPLPITSNHTFNRFIMKVDRFGG